MAHLHLLPALCTVPCTVPFIVNGIPMHSMVGCNAQHATVCYNIHRFCCGGLHCQKRVTCAFSSGALATDAYWMGCLKAMHINAYCNTHLMQHNGMPKREWIELWKCESHCQVLIVVWFSIETKEENTGADSNIILTDVLTLPQSTKKIVSLLSLSPSDIFNQFGNRQVTQLLNRAQLTSCIYVFELTATSSSEASTLCKIPTSFK